MTKIISVVPNISEGRDAALRGRAWHIQGSHEREPGCEAGRSRVRSLVQPNVGVHAGLTVTQLRLAAQATRVGVQLSRSRSEAIRCGTTCRRRRRSRAPRP